MSEPQVRRCLETPAPTSSVGSSPVNVAVVGPHMAARGGLASVAAVLATWLPAVSRRTGPVYSAMAVGGFGVCSWRSTQSCVRPRTHVIRP